MRFDKFTIKSQELLQKAQSLASRHNNQQIEPEHLMHAMLSEPEGIARSMLNKLGYQYQVPVYETGVGFKYVAPKMLEVDALIGGEESGGYAFRRHIPDRDGILAGLYMLDLMVRLKRKPSELVELLFEQVGPHFYNRIDSPLPSRDRSEVEEQVRAAHPVTIGGLHVTDLNTLDGFKFSLEDGGWLLIRFSGTEPIVRVYCETTQADRVQPILQDGLKILGIK